MEQSTLDYYEPIFFEVVKRNPEKFVGLIKPFIDSRSNQRWITTEELCEAIGTSASSWHKSEISSGCSKKNRYTPIQISSEHD